MSRNGTSAIYKSTYYLGIVYAKLATTDRLKVLPMTWTTSLAFPDIP